MHRLQVLSKQLAPGQAQECEEEACGGTQLQRAPASAAAGQVRSRERAAGKQWSSRALGEPLPSYIGAHAPYAPPRAGAG
jgi:hypothetical protein